MINIPEEIKKLFRHNSIQKNVRISFPNGEHPDITKNNLEAESVTFTERLCSQDNLKFGLCEANVLEFEAIGIGNIQGCKIECSLEIDISSLDEEIKTEYGQTSDDVEYLFYAVPLGVYIVDSCKRQNDMSKRKIVAYSEIITDKMALSKLEKAKQACFVRSNSNYEFDLLAFMYSNINNLDRAFLEESYYYDMDRTFSSGYYYDHATGRTATVRCIAQSYTFYSHGNGSTFVQGLKVEPDSLYRAVVTKRDSCENSVARIKELLKNGYWGSETGEQYEGVTEDVVKQMMHPFIHLQKVKSMSSFVLYVNEFIPYESDQYIYPYINGMEDDSDYYRMTLRIPVNIVLQWDDTQSYETLSLFNGNALYSAKAKESAINIRMAFPRTVTYGNAYYLLETLPMKQLLSAYAEINGMFGRSDREGIYRFATLKNTWGLYPSENLYPSEDLFPDECNNIASTYDHRNLWYEEYTVQPFGKVVAVYLDEEGTLQKYVQVFDESARNVYYFNDNYIFLNAKMSEGQVKKLLETYFIPNITGISYTPADITMTGLPYMEVGDTLNVLTNEGGFETLVFSRTMQGIQSLSDNVETKGDEVNADIVSNLNFYKEI